MKKFMYPLVLLVILLQAKSVLSDSVKKESAVVSKAIVYLRGAQLTCTADFTAAPGNNQFIFEGVSPNLDPNSLQASAKGNITIMDVKFQIRYNEIPLNYNNSKTDRRMKEVNDSLVMLKFEIDELNEQAQGLSTEKNILLNNRLLKGESSRDTLEMFKDGIEFLRSRLKNISAESTLIKKKLYYKNDEKTQLEKRIQDLNKISQSGSTPVKESIPSIVATVFSEIQNPVKVSVSFFVDQAAWLPSYDIRATNDGTIDLSYKAELRQQTGMDWKNVSLTLSTGNPALATQKPVLTPFYLNFVQSYRNKIALESREMLSKTLSKQGALAAEESSKDEAMLDAASLASYTEQREGMLQTEYEIKLKYSIPHDDEMHVVAIQSKSLKSTYQYSAVPKLDINAYLLADVTEMDELNLIPGSSRLYLDGTFIGKSVLNPDAFSDTIRLSFGKDRSIVVNRKKLKDKTTERILVDEKTVSTTYELKIKNNKPGSINLDLSDQIPVSRDPAIKVQLIDGEGSVLNDESGILNWKLSLKPYESKTIHFSYEVKMPKSKSLAGM